MERTKVPERKKGSRTAKDMLKAYNITHENVMFIIQNYSVTLQKIQNHSNYAQL